MMEAPIPRHVAQAYGNPSPPKTVRLQVHHIHGKQKPSPVDYLVLQPNDTGSDEVSYQYVHTKVSSVCTLYRCLHFVLRYR